MANKEELILISKNVIPQTILTVREDLFILTFGNNNIPLGYDEAYKLQEYLNVYLHNPIK
jgi:hypothetical protein